jgi:hypothetical protein
VNDKQPVALLDFRQKRPPPFLVQSIQATAAVHVAK